MSWPAGWCRGPNWPAAWTEAQRLEAERACEAPRARDAPPPPPLKRRVSFREDKLCDVFEYEKEEEEPEPEPVMLAYKAVPKTRHSALSLFRDARLPALVAAGADRARATKDLAKQFVLFKKQDKAAFDALQARAKELNDALPP